METSTIPSAASKAVVPPPLFAGTNASVKVEPKEELADTQALENLSNASNSGKDESPHSEGLISDEEVANFRGALHDDESPALNEEGQVVRGSKKSRSAYFPSMSRESSYRHSSPANKGLSPYGNPSKASTSACNLSGTSLGSGDRPSASPGFSGLSRANPFLHSNIFSTEISLRGGGNGGSNDSADTEATDPPKQQPSHKRKSSKGRVKSVKLETGNAEDQHLRDSSASDVNTIKPTATAASKNKAKRKATTPAPSGSAGGPAFKRLAPLKEFEADLRARESAQHTKWLEDWEASEREKKKLLELLRIWTLVAETRETERANARLETRLEKVRMEEEKVRAKEAHRDQVVGALKQVLGMLDNDEEDITEEDGGEQDAENSALEEEDGDQGADFEEQEVVNVESGEDEMEA